MMLLKQLDLIDESNPHRDDLGSVMIFLPGLNEIKEVENNIRRHMDPGMG